MNDSTDINALPTNPASGNNNQAPANITLQKNESSSLEKIVLDRENEIKNYNNLENNNSNKNNMPSPLEQKSINNLISGIQQASASGLTMLPSRDIPLNTNNLTQDQQTNVNYIPQPNNNYYIENQINENMSDMFKNSNNNSSNNSLDKIYDELQIPILLAVIFFMFQLPIFKKYLFKFLPILFSNDGNLNLQGYVLYSILFATAYYIIQKIFKYLTTA
jgi:hypothetical protein